MNLYLEVNLDDIRGGDRGPVIRQWFHDMSSTLFASIESGANVRWFGGVTRAQDDTMVHFDDTPDRRVAFDGELQAGPFWAEASLNTSDEEQIARLRTFPTLFDDPRFLSLSAIVPCGDREANDEGFCSRLVDSIANVAAQLNPVFGRVEQGVGRPETNLDVGLRRNRLISVPDGRKILRGYAWAMIVPAEILSRLGGPEGVSSTGAFYRILPLPAGGAVLQASPTIAGYTDAVMDKTFKALVPVLPSGMPRSNVARPGVRFVLLDAGELRKEQG